LNGILHSITRDRELGEFRDKVVMETATAQYSLSQTNAPGLNGILHSITRDRELGEFRDKVVMETATAQYSLSQTNAPGLNGILHTLLSCSDFEDKVVTN
jgi:hypothetical protein